MGASAAARVQQLRDDLVAVGKATESLLILPTQQILDWQLTREKRTRMGTENLMNLTHL